MGKTWGLLIVMCDIVISESMEDQDRISTGKKSHGKSQKNITKNQITTNMIYLW